MFVRLIHSRVKGVAVFYKNRVSKPVMSLFPNTQFLLIRSDMCPPDLTVVLAFSTVSMSFSVPINIFLAINLL